MTQVGSIYLYLIILIYFQFVSSYFEFCSDSKLYKLKTSTCEGGVLFKVAKDLTCSYPKEKEFFTDVCNEETSDYDPTGATFRSKIQYITMDNDDQPRDPTTDPYKTEGCASTCNGEVIEIDSTNGVLPESLAELPFSASEERENLISGVVSDDSHVKAQTQRLFLYLSDLIIDEGEGGPNIRLAKVMRQSFEIFKDQCPKEYVPSDFMTQLEKAFFFLLREGDLGHLKDLSEDDFEQIQTSLKSCRHIKPRPFRLNGITCQTKGIVHNMSSEMIDLTVSYKRTVDSFRWGKYDVPVDAAWNVADFVHGLCYGKFSHNINKHHQYQRAMESLFTPELLYRWQRPFKLNIPAAWDNYLMAEMKSTMRNLDACVQASYLGSPFLRRLQRPWITSDDSQSQQRRRRREVEDEEGSSTTDFICFTSIKDQVQLVDNYKKKCS